MRLRKPCEHNRYDPHVTGYASPTCPGGEFLPEDAELVERIAETIDQTLTAVLAPELSLVTRKAIAFAVLDALK